MSANLSKLSKYYHTARALKGVQVYHQVRKRFRRAKPRTAPAPSLRAMPGPWLAVDARAAVMLSPNTLRFLNQTHTIARPEDWNPAHDQKVTVYNLHYFDDLAAQGAPARAAWHQALIERWIAENPPGHGLGWDAYPTSLRIINWIKWALAGNALSPAARHSLAVQARYLADSLEIYLLGNHLFENARALVFAGAFFSGPEADRWLRIGLRILDRELPEQFLPDGAHFELSPMYQAILLEGILDLVALCRCAGSEAGEPLQALQPRLQEIAQRMRRWLRVMSHPDGDIALFNDAAFGVAAGAAELDAYSAALGLPPVALPAESVVHLADSGYVRVARGPAVALLDAGPIGPRHLPPHSHADSLTFELSIDQSRLIVNPGTSTYAVSPQRLRERGTAAHNTVTVDDADSSEVWGSFRVARRAEPLPVTIERGAGGEDRIAAGHTGYTRLPGRTIHHRVWSMTDLQLRIEDRLEGGFRSAVARFHIHPDWTVHSAPGGIELRRGARVVRLTAEGAELTIEPAAYHPEFGVGVPNVCIVCHMTGARAAYALSWS